MVKACKSNESCTGVIQCKVSGERASNAWVTYPGLRNSGSKGPVILDDVSWSHGQVTKGPPVWERPMSYQVVGEVMAHQAYDG